MATPQKPLTWPRHRGHWHVPTAFRLLHRSIVLMQSELILNSWCSQNSYWELHVPSTDFRYIIFTSTEKAQGVQHASFFNSELAHSSARPHPSHGFQFWIEKDPRTSQILALRITKQAVEQYCLEHPSFQNYPTRCCFYFSKQHTQTIHRFTPFEESSISAQLPETVDQLCAKTKLLWFANDFKCCWRRLTNSQTQIPQEWNTSTRKVRSVLEVSLP